MPVTAPAAAELAVTAAIAVAVAVLVSVGGAAGSAGLCLFEALPLYCVLRTALSEDITRDRWIVNGEIGLTWLSQSSGIARA